jgi:hypothetical protein
MERLEKLETGLAAQVRMDQKGIEKMALEVKELKLQIRQFLLDLESTKFLVPVQECCPCSGAVPGGKLEVNVNLQNPVPGVVGATVVEPVPVVQPVVQLYPMASDKFAQLLEAIEDQGFSDDKLSVLSEAARHSAFAVEQLLAVLKLFSFPDDKLEALRTVKTLIVDPENLFQVYGAFVHSSDKEEAKRILEGR